jgi:hypothetical protein
MRVHVFRLASALVGSACLFAAAPAAAHHSFSAEFDENNCGEFSGTLVAVDWQNPHAYFFIETKAADGSLERLTFQTSSIANMTRGGTPRRYFVENIGKMLIVRGCASKNGTDNRYAASFVKLLDGPVHRVGQDVEGIFGSNR